MTLVQRVLSQDAARAALVSRLVRTLSADRAQLVDATGRVEALADNVVGSLTIAQIGTLTEQLASGDGSELDRGEHGERPDAFAAHSSAALALNAFGAWLGHESALKVAGLDGFTEPIRLEAKQRVFRGGRAPNLDCLLWSTDAIVGVESKLTEPLAIHSPKQWSEAYGRDSCRHLLTDGWRLTLDEARNGHYKSVHLDAAQLIKHALGLRRQHPTKSSHLVYVYWEPQNGDDFANVRRHRTEVDELLERVGEASPRLHALTYDELWRKWDGIRDVGWLPDHLARLRERYALEVRAGDRCATSMAACVGGSAVSMKANRDGVRS